jgi:essential nuclear protein 1
MEMVVLERVREDIYENKKLNVHLFNCLKRGLYKPAGFFKGLLKPIHPTVFFKANSST